jgi:shikimate dehydrogenase
VLKLALLGKSIQHSKSEEIYKTILPINFTYSLLDIDNPENIPSAINLLNQFNAINITAPYKTHFLNQISNVEEMTKIGAMNLLYKKNDMIFGANTDYLALIDEIKLGRINTFKKLVLLGDGAMANVWKHILDQFNYSYVQFSRRLNPNIAELDFSSFSQCLVINCCTRSFLFKGKMSNDSTYWDMNYQSHAQESLIKSLGCPYWDGLDLLKNQAVHASKLFLR